MATESDSFGDELPVGAIARFGTTRWRHTAFCLNVAFVGGGDSLMTAGYDGTVEQWEVPSGKRIRTFGRDLGVIKSLDVSPDGRFVAAGSQTKFLQVWRVSTGDVAWTAKTPLPLTHFAAIRFSPDSKVLAATDSASVIRLFNAESGLEENVLTDERHSIESLAWSADGRLLGSGDEYGNVEITEIASGKCLLKLKHDDQVNDICFSPDGVLFASVSGAHKLRRHLGNKEDASIRICNLRTGLQVSIVRTQANSIEGVAFSPDGRQVAITEEKIVRTFDVSSDGMLTEKEILPGRSFLFSLRFSRNGKFLAASSEGLAPCLWELSTGSDVIGATGQTDTILNAEYGADGKTIISTSLDGTAMASNLNLLTQTSLPAGTFGGGTGVSRSGKYIIAKKGAPTFNVRVISLDSSQTAVEFSPGDFSLGFDIEEKTDQIAVSGFFGVGVWKLSTGKPVFTTKLDDDFLHIVYLGLHGTRIVTWNVEEPTLHVIDAASGTLISSIETGRHCPDRGDMSPDGRLLAAVLLDHSWENRKPSKVVLYDIGNPRKRQILSWKGADACCVRFQSDGLLATGHNDGAVRFWNPESRKLMQITQCGSQSIRRLLFHPNGKEFATVQPDATILVWRMP